jgi:hypothetical protein
MTMNLGRRGTTAPHHHAGLDDEIPSSRRRALCLDIPFYRTGFSATGFSRAGVGAAQRFDGGAAFPSLMRRARKIFIKELDPPLSPPATIPEV